MPPVTPQNLQATDGLPSGSDTKAGRVQPGQSTTRRQGRSPLPTQTRGLPAIGAVLEALIVRLIMAAPGIFRLPPREVGSVRIGLVLLS